MSSQKRENYFSFSLFFLLFWMSPLFAQTGMPPVPGTDVMLTEIMTALRENKEYAVIEAGRVNSWKQLASLREKLASQKPELNRLLNEQKRLQKTLADAGKTKKSKGEIGRCRARLNEVTWELDREFSKSDEYARLFLHAGTVSAKENLLALKILNSSSDERILKFHKLMDKTFCDYTAYSVRNLPKAEVEGSDEYRTAVKGIEKYRENPSGGKGIMEYRCSPVREKMKWRAGKESAIRELNRDLSLTTAELQWRKCLLEEKYADLAWQVRTLPTSLEIRTPEGTRKYDVLQKKLQRIIQSDPEYAGLEEKERTLRDAQMKAVEDFAAKSNVQEAVEYRKIMAMLEDANQTSSGKTK